MLEETETTLETYRDRVDRSLIVSPVSGVIHKSNLNTVGGVIKEGDPIFEISPREETPFIEAFLDPKDIAFIEPKQTAILTFTAYDPSIFGTLNGKVESISADTNETSEGVRFFKIKIETETAHLEKNDQKYRITSGMNVDVNIVTGRRKVLHYLLKPFLNAKNNALQER